jgi:predicted lipoprotein with Yx(FWY)xxD motif
MTLGRHVCVWVCLLLAPTVQAQDVVVLPLPAQNAVARSIGSQQIDLPPAQLIRSHLATPAGASDGYPAGVTVAHSKLGLIYVDANGKTLYAMNGGMVNYRRTQDALKFCVGFCAEKWRAYVPDGAAKAVGAWRILNGAQGPQWAYGNNLVFTFNDDKKPGDLNGHEYEDVWFAINYIPPAPRDLQAPPSVRPLLVNDTYVLADDQGRALFAYDSHGGCNAGCDGLVPFNAGMASRSVGQWAVTTVADRPQWTFRGKLVYASVAGPAAKLPSAAIALRP